MLMSTMPGEAKASQRSNRSATVPAPQPGVVGLLDEHSQLGAGVTARAVHGLGCPAFAPHVGVDAEVDAQLPAVQAALTK
jgi:hypothetical protein